MAKNEVSASIAAIDAYVAVLLEKISEGKRVISLQKGKRIFSQGDHADAIYADAIYFVQSGRAKISVLCDQLFNHSEKRLARVLLKLARLREEDVAPDATIPLFRHEILAEMVGTTRSRINHFMNKSRKMGLIDYNGGLIVRIELLTDVVLHD